MSRTPFFDLKFDGWSCNLLLLAVMVDVVTTDGVNGHPVSGQHRRNSSLNAANTSFLTNTRSRKDKLRAKKEKFKVKTDAMKAKLNKGEEVEVVRIHTAASAVAHLKQQGKAPPPPLPGVTRNAAGELTVGGSNTRRKTRSEEEIKAAQVASIGLMLGSPGLGGEGGADGQKKRERRSSIFDSSAFKKEFGSGIALTCPAQGIPIPAFR